MASISGSESDPAASAVHGTHESTGTGVLGESKIGPGVVGISTGEDPNERGVGVIGRAIGAAVVGESSSWMGVFGTTNSTSGGAGVMGQSTTGGAGVVGESAMGPGVMGTSSGTDPNQVGVGLFGKAVGSAIVGESQSGFGLFARTQSGEAAVRGDHAGDGFGGFFTGHVGVTRELRVNESIHTIMHVHVGGNIHVKGDVQLEGADLAEEFEVEGDGFVEPGCVVVATGHDAVTLGSCAYDRRVAGVVSGAGACRPGLVLDRRDAQGGRRWPVALAGKVWCRVDADLGAIEVGDPLTSSSTPGHAMRADDPSRAFGAVLGKAVGRLTRGRGLVPILVSLQ